MPPSKAKRGTPNGTGGAASSSKAFTGAGHQQRGAAVVCSTASQPNAEQEATKWDKFTDRLVSLSSIPFSILVLPQVVQNLTNMTAGNAGALSIISWEVSEAAYVCTHGCS